ncbi:fibronectin type III domain-containing protein [Mycobacterium eburneum]|nr:fibronectin type III domain-containing protein [Mycobacterium eburneum]TDH48891.1 fibronectin type III domain-containing protein [Mycobacterium eburneum]
MTTLPATGGAWADVYQPLLQPLAERYWQITDILIRDYFDANGNPRNLADPSVGLGSQGLFTPFAADGTLREDLIAAGWVYGGMLADKSMKITPDVTVKETPTAQIVRTTRNVFTKLDDKIDVTFIEAGPVMDAMRYELPLNLLGTSTIPLLGTPGYQVKRGESDQVIERQVVLLGTDNGFSRAEVFPRVATDKKGATSLDREATEDYPWTASVLPDPYSRASMWICRGGPSWSGLGNFSFETTPPIVTPVTGLKATVVVPTPIDMTSPTYTVALQTTANGAFTAGTVATDPTVSGSFTTLTVTGLTASQAYNALQVTATAGEVSVTSPVSAAFTATAS